MSQKEFIDQVSADLQKFAPLFGGIEAEYTFMEKLQDESYEALALRRVGSDVSALLRMDLFWEEYQDGRSYMEVLQDIIGVCLTQIENMPMIDINDFIQYDNAKQYLFLQAVGTEHNREMLKQIPHFEMEDISIVCRLVRDHNEKWQSSTLINRGMLEKYGVSEKQLFQDAREIASLRHPVEMRSIADVVNEMLGVDVPMFEKEDYPMEVATVSSRTMGAGVIAYPDFMEMAAEKMKGNFYLLPSSIHEVILIPDSIPHSVEELKMMVTLINRSEVSRQERLTDNVYHYDAKERVFEQAEKYEARKSRERKSVLASLHENASKSKTIAVPKKMHQNEEISL